jgi:plastocyanin
MPDGRMRAYDAAKGTPLWEFQTGAAVTSPPATYEIGSEPYVVTAAGDTVWAFKIGGTIGPKQAPVAKSLDADIFNQPTAAKAVSEFAGRIYNTDKIAMSAVLKSTLGGGGDASYREEYTFAPIRVRVKAGTRVTWTNAGKMPHEAKAQDGSWATGKIMPGASASILFDKPGTYTYVCSDHPWSFAQLIVEP